MSSRLKPFYTKSDGSLKRENDTIKRPDLAATLDKIAEKGAKVFYSGNIADDIIEAVRFHYCNLTYSSN